MVRLFIRLLMTGFLLVPDMLFSVHAQEADVVETPFGRFVVLPDRATLKNRDSFGLEAMRPVTGRLTPYIDNEHDLRTYLFGEGNEDVALGDAYKLFQVIEGLPDGGEYNDPAYNAIKQGFTQECKLAANRYIEAIQQLLQRAGAAVGSIAQTWHRDIDAAVVRTYDKECLTPLSAIPPSVLKVTGTLFILIDNKYRLEFCSATVVGYTKLITARHCFFDPGTGKASDFLPYLRANNVVFKTFLKNGSAEHFSIKPFAGADMTEKSYGAAEDKLILSLSSGYFDVRADAATAADRASAMPKDIWLVGNNALLGDVMQSTQVHQYARGSGPKACALLKVTAAGCIYHSCQSGMATSGGGLLVRTVDPNSGDEAISVWGVHHGPSARATTCGGNAPVIEVLNLAAFVSP